MVLITVLMERDPRVAEKQQSLLAAFLFGKRMQAPCGG